MFWQLKATVPFVFLSIEMHENRNPFKCNCPTTSVHANDAYCPITQAWCVLCNCIVLLMLKLGLSTIVLVAQLKQMGKCWSNDNAKQLGWHTKFFLKFLSAGRPVITFITVSICWKIIKEKLPLNMPPEWGDITVQICCKIARKKDLYPLPCE